MSTPFPNSSYCLWLVTISNWLFPHVVLLQENTTRITILQPTPFRRKAAASLARCTLDIPQAIKFCKNEFIWLFKWLHATEWTVINLIQSSLTTHVKKCYKTNLHFVLPSTSAQHNWLAVLSERASTANCTWMSWRSCWMLARADGLSYMTRNLT